MICARVDISASIAIRRANRDVMETYVFVYKDGAVLLDSYQKARRGSPVSKYITCKRWDCEEGAKGVEKPQLPEDVVNEAVAYIKSKVISAIKKVSFDIKFKE